MANKQWQINNKRKHHSEVPEKCYSHRQQSPEKCYWWVLNARKFAAHKATISLPKMPRKNQWDWHYTQPKLKPKACPKLTLPETNRKPEHRSSDDACFWASMSRGGEGDRWRFGWEKGEVKRNFGNRHAGRSTGGPTTRFPSLDFAPEVKGTARVSGERREKKSFEAEAG